MMIINWKPVKGETSMNPFFSMPSCGHGYRKNESSARRYPATDIYDTETDIVFKMETPGFTKDELNVEMKDNILSIKGEKVHSETPDGEANRTESLKNNFSRSFRLPKNVNAQEIDASLRDGILELRVPKAEEAKPRNISISVN